MRTPSLRSALFLATVASLAAASAAAAARAFPAFFLGAGAGSEVPFETVALPTPSVTPPQAAGAALLRTLALPTAFTPSLHQLLEGETIITTDKQMREVWARLFSEPYDAAQFDFSSTFVVLVGGGPIANGSFDISAVEQVEATYADPGGLGGGTATETFLSVVATTFLNGVQPVEPPPVTWHVAAVKVSRALLDDVVFRRNVILGV